MVKPVSKTRQQKIEKRGATIQIQNLVIGSSSDTIQIRSISQVTSSTAVMHQYYIVMICNWYYQFTIPNNQYNTDEMNSLGMQWPHIYSLSMYIAIISFSLLWFWNNMNLNIGSKDPSKNSRYDTIRSRVFEMDLVPIQILKRWI